MDDRDGQSRLDAALVERAVRDGDTRAFEALVRRHQGLVRAQLRRLLGHDAAMADDLAQETFVLAWRKLEQFRGDSRFATWLYRIAHSCFLQFLRSHGRQAETVALDPDADHAADADPQDLELRLDLTAALQHLSMNQRAALLYCEQLGLSHQEAAEVLDMPLGTVKTHVMRGKARLRELLRDWAPHPMQGTSP
ncbi:sigma-70 family RNA polymerase sigma factor [Roseateles asaccharophilus]|uniref:RNA polymerase sigma factor n=1 Tax=Roseateles asaccharophilus TaxID=582607 RepID=A0ABU2A9U2_9BURK|nr:sigma-70 family RNA polymerase sigma factor [Roseateles asaccharophilus]MDR7333971.1 RNA polymerase sigma-70 factor (ECF subfamily) [Roseateles asaccharophilus]